MLEKIQSLGELPNYDDTTNSGTEMILRQAITQLGLDALQVKYAKQISEAIAALDNSDKVLPQHITEAIMYRRFCFCRKCG